MTIGTLFLAISLVNGIFIVMVRFDPPISSATRLKAIAWVAIMFAYVETPIMLHGLGNPYVVLGLASLPLAVGLRLIRDRRAPASATVLVTVGAAVAAYGAWILVHNGAQSLTLPIGVAIATGLITTALAAATIVGIERLRET
jgi:hypothetical protein